MRVTLVTIRVVGNPNYDALSLRWLETYNRFKPTMNHDVVVVNCDHDRPDDLYDSVATRQITYRGGGWDCGTWQFVSKKIDTDLLVCCNTSTYFWRPGWMERFVEEAQKNGYGLYGSMASLEIAPHLRTPCYVFQPKVMWDYPHIIDSRQKTYMFECAGGKDTFTMYCRRKGYRTLLVTWNECHDMPLWRQPPNIFRRGDQSNILVKDRHALHYEMVDDNEKRNLAKLADGG